MIIKCDCISQYQDAKYGKGYRVYNPQGGKNEGKARCTVCGESRFIDLKKVKDSGEEK